MTNLGGRTPPARSSTSTTCPTASSPPRRGAPGRRPDRRTSSTSPRSPPSTRLEVDVFRRLAQRRCSPQGRPVWTAVRAWLDRLLDRRAERDGRAAPGAARRGDAADAVRGRRLRRLLRLAGPRLQRRQDLPARRRAAAAELAAPAGRLPRPRRHRRGLRAPTCVARRAAQGARRRTPRPSARATRLDIEAELGFVVGAPSALGEPGRRSPRSPTTSSAWSGSTTGRRATSRRGSTSRSARSSASRSRPRSPAGSPRWPRSARPGSTCPARTRSRSTTSASGRRRGLRHRRRGACSTGRSSRGRRTRRCTGRPPRCSPT